MGDNTLTTIGEPATVEVADVNQYFTALVGDSIPRNTSTGAPEDNVHKLGRPAFRWLQAHITDLFLGGSLFDPNAVGADTKFSIQSGATRTDSEQPDFLRADGVGAGANATILAAATDLTIIANNTSVTVVVDIAISSLTVAPSANNTCLVNDTDLAGADETKFKGEDTGSIITIDTVGSEISDRIGEFICLKTPTGEFMFTFVEDATTLNRCYRGFFFDDTGTPVVRGVLSNNDTLTLMSLGWVFLDKNGTTVDVSYTSPIYSGVEPSSPVTDDYWFDLKNRLWKRFDGSSFQQVDRMLIGLLVIDQTDCIVARSFDFTKGYDDFIDLEIELESVTEAKTQKGYSRASVYGITQELYAKAFVWDITTDLETGVSEAASTEYYIYLTEEGIPIISDERPYDRRSELKGLYHPYHSWRNVGRMFNDSSSNLISASSNNKPDGSHVRTQVVSGATSVQFDASDFREDASAYVIEMYDVVPGTNNTDLWARVIENGVVKTTIYDHSQNEHASFTSDTGNTFATTSATSDAQFIISATAVGRGDLINDANTALSGFIKISNVHSGTRFKMVEWSTIHENALVTQGSSGGGARTEGTTPVNGIEILASSGTISGTFILRRIEEH